MKLLCIVLVGLFGLSTVYGAVLHGSWRRYSKLENENTGLQVSTYSNLATEGSYFDESEIVTEIVYLYDTDLITQIQAGGDLEPGHDLHEEERMPRPSMDPTGKPKGDKSTSIEADRGVNAEVEPSPHVIKENLNVKRVLVKKVDPPFSRLQTKPEQVKIISKPKNERKSLTPLSHSVHAIKPTIKKPSQAVKKTPEANNRRVIVKEHVTKSDTSKGAKMILESHGRGNTNVNKEANDENKTPNISKEDLLLGLKEKQEFDKQNKRLRVSISDINQEKASESVNTQVNSSKNKQITKSRKKFNSNKKYSVNLENRQQTSQAKKGTKNVDATTIKKKNEPQSAPVHHIVKVISSKKIENTPKTTNDKQSKSDTIVNKGKSETLSKETADNKINIYNPKSTIDTSEKEKSEHIPSRPNNVKTKPSIHPKFTPLKEPIKSEEEEIPPPAPKTAPRPKQRPPNNSPVHPKSKQPETKTRKQNITEKMKETKNEVQETVAKQQEAKITKQEIKNDKKIVVEKHFEEEEKSHENNKEPLNSVLKEEEQSKETARLDSLSIAKKRSNTYIVAVCFTLIISTILLTIVGIYFRKITVERRRYLGHTLLETEDDVPLFNREAYSDHSAGYESWNQIQHGLPM